MINKMTDKQLGLSILLTGIAESCAALIGVNYASLCIKAEAIIVLVIENVLLYFLAKEAWKR